MEHENLLDAWGFRDDFNDFMDNYYPDVDTNRFDIISIEMDQLQIDYNQYKFLKNGN